MDSSSQRRLEVTLGHLKACSPSSVEAESCAGKAAASSPSFSFSDPSVDVSALRTAFDGKQAAVKNATRSIIESDPIFTENPEVIHDMKKYRDLVSSWVQSFLNNPRRPAGLKDIHSDPEKFSAMMETIGMFSANLFVKLSVQLSLWGATVLNLGTERHAALLPDIDSGKLPGCFGMTELGHGSNVRGVETTATYDPATQEFVINSPSPTAPKFWIGNAAKDARLCTAFARLIINGQDKGVHAFIAPLRTADGKTYPGVTIRDCGHKQGLNGIDNGSIAWNNVRIPRVNLLNRYSDVTPSGQYECKLSSESRHFGATVGELSGGRLYIAAGGVSAGKNGLAVALRYGAVRRQFDPSGNGQEVPILSYPTHQRRLAPMLARIVAMDFTSKFVAEQFGKSTPESIPALHALSAGFKAVSSWAVHRALQTSRECCGGQGYRSGSRIPALLADTNIFMTFEGDNTVLMQQVTKYLLAEYQRMSKSGKFSGVLSYMAKEAAPNACAAGSEKSMLNSTCYLLSMFEAREAGLLKQLTQQLAAAARSGVAASDAWTAALPLVGRLADAHMDRVVHTQVTAAANSASSAGVRRPLEKMALLNAVLRVQDDLGWFVANDVMPHNVARAVDAVFGELSAEVTSFSLSVVEAFGLPSKSLPRADLMDY